MPGVPSYRGCDACRKQKKKCDASLPACSRCARLRIPCVGTGQRRFKFYNQTLPASVSRDVSWSSAVPSPDVPGQGAQLEIYFLRGPSNAVSLRVNKLVSALEVHDPRFSLSVYGGFLRDIPQRLGRNEALDAAIDAILTALPLVQSRQQPSTKALSKYACALKALRVCLGDPVKLASSDTMCALYLVVVCQGWLGDLHDHQPSHGEALTYMLNAVPRRTWKVGFELDVVTTLCALVIFESFINPRIQLDPDLWGLPETLGPRSPTDAQSVMDSLRSRNLARITTLLRSPKTHLIEIYTTYQRICRDATIMATILAAIPTTLSSDGPTSLSRMLHVRYQTGYGILLVVAILLNKVLQGHQAFSSSNSRSSLRKEAAGFVESILTLAEQASQYRPFGASGTPPFLWAAYAALEDGENENLQRVETLLTEYQSDFTPTRDSPLGGCMRKWLRNDPPRHPLDSSETHDISDNTKKYVNPAGGYFADKADLCCIL